ncbi:TetR/AcrR family transcriptional regulator [Metabacillus fastidiosus]|uniref:TetR/AcrR family transcriptional regulator n=1 Tax=Metabacillus fastidiosus TaxID=1458 RepID=UPI003D26DEAB
MNKRKQHVIKMAHQLFIDKGFQATSIQDILEISGISKGTFYNYFSSKSELLIALFRMIYEQLEHDRNKLLIGQDPSDIEIFIKQVELQMETNRANKLISLFEEVLVLNDSELKKSIRYGHFKMINWLYNRFIDIFGESKKPFLLDSAIMFTGILQNNLKYYHSAYGTNVSIHQVIRYSVERIVKMIDEVSKTGDQLLNPELLDNWLPNSSYCNENFKKKLANIVLDLKKMLDHSKEQEKYIELLDFIQEELSDSKNPRQFLIESALLFLNNSNIFLKKQELQYLEQLIRDYLNQIGKTN